MSIRKNKHSDYLKETLDYNPNWLLRMGNSFVMLFLFAIILLSILIKYPETLTGKVIITSEDPPQKIYSRVTGKIDSIFYKNNQEVNSNEPIILIENTANYQDIDLLKETIDKYPVTIDNLNFPLDDLPILLLGEIEESYSKFENSLIQYNLLSKYKDYDIKNESNIYNVLEKKRKLQSLNTKVEIDRSELELKKLDVERQRELYEKGIISKKELEENQIEYLQTQKLAEDTQLDISELKNEINLSNKNLVLNDIDKIREIKQLIKQVVQNFNRLKIAIDQWEKKYVIMSSRNGIVTFSNFRKKNNLVNPGDLMVNIVPNSSSKPIGKVNLPILHSGKVKIGQNVKITLDNYPYMEFGMLEGKVSNISLMPDSENMYLVDVELSNDLTTTYKKELLFQHEMSGQAKIITKKISLLGRVFNNFRYLFSDKQ